MTERKKMSANLRTMLQKLAAGPVVYTYAPNGKGVKLESSTTSVSLKKHFEDLAHSGHAFRRDTGEPTGCPPTMSITFTLTALGREELDMYAATHADTRVSAPASEAKLLAESQG